MTKNCSDGIFIFVLTIIIIVILTVIIIIIDNPWLVMNYLYLAIEIKINQSINQINKFLLKTILKYIYKILCKKTLIYHVSSKEGHFFKRTGQVLSYKLN